MRVRGILAGFIALASVAGVGVGSAGAVPAPGQIPIDRWFGAEAGFYEASCYGFASDCPGFLAVGTFFGEVGASKTHTRYEDPDGIEREWPARTGNYLFMANSPGGLPASATLSSFGSTSGPVPAGTVSFAFRVHTLPLQPVVIYRHLGRLPAETPVVTITLSPDGRLLLSTAGSSIGSSVPLKTEAWHAVTVTYGSQQNTPVKLYVNDEVPVEGNLPLPGPSGDVDLGIVSPTSAPFTIGLDDFVNSPAFDAQIHEARINYLMPLGETTTAWGKDVYPDEACRGAARNWQFVSEDQRVLHCDLGGSAIRTSQNGAVDEYLTEGIPSMHKPGSSYHRDVLAQPTGDDRILGVRLRMKAKTDGPSLPFWPGFLDGGVLTQEPISFDNGGTGLAPRRWGKTYPTRAGGAQWTRDALGSVKLRLDSGPGLSGIPVARYVFEVRLDYLWVP